MTKFTTLSAELREDVGKGASRRLRRAGRVPAVIYGGDREPASLTMEHRELWHAAQNEAFFSSILDVTVSDGRSQQVVIRDMQRHPFKALIMHVDFMRVSATEELRISIPLHFTGEEESPAGKEPGVVIQHQITEIEVAAKPGDLPEYLAVDLSALEPGGSVMLSEITLPKGVSIPSHGEAEDMMVANAVHISQDQGTGADEEDEVAADEVEVIGESEEGDEDAGSEDGGSDDDKS
jgi:large subunit ribosomal protein L25